MYNLLFFCQHILGHERYVRFLGESQEKLFERILSELDSNCFLPSVKNLPEESSDISDSEFLSICKDGPLVFRGAAKEWPAVKKWSLEYFEENYGDSEVIIMDNVGLTYDEYEKLPFRDYIGQLKTGSTKYLKFSDFVHDNPELKEDFDLDWLRKLKNLPFSWGEDTRFFMGGHRTKTPLHVGFSSFFFTQVIGQKKWVFYAPNNRMFLDARTERTTYLFSDADPYNLEDPKFPLLKYATRFEVTLNPGDIIWVPSFTWHYVENPGLSVALRYGRASLPLALYGSKMFTALMFLTTKPTIIEHVLTTVFKKRDSIYLKSQKELNKSDPFAKLVNKKG